jgi:hypothetical protein
MRPAYETVPFSAELILDISDSHAASRGAPRSRPLPIEPLILRFVARIEGGARVALPDPLELVTSRGPSGFFVYYGLVKSADGGPRCRQLPPGDYFVNIRSNVYAESEVQVHLPSPRRAYEVDLLPGPAYPFTLVSPLSQAAAQAAGCSERALKGRPGTTLLRGTLRGTDGQPVPGAAISASIPARQGPGYITSASGEWLLVFPSAGPAGDWPSGPVTVRVALPAAGAAPAVSFDVPGVCVVRGYDTSLLHTAFRGRVVDAAGRPAAGARLTLAGLDANQNEVLRVAEQPVTGADGSWAYYFRLDQPPANVAYLVVTTPDANGQLRREIVPVLTRATAVVPDIHL